MASATPSASLATPSQQPTATSAVAATPDTQPTSARTAKTPPAAAPDESASRRRRTKGFGSGSRHETSASRGRDFRVGNVGNGGLIYLRYVCCSPISAA